MDDEIRKIELETARLRLEREKLALAKETRNFKQSEAMQGIASEVAQGAAKNGFNMVKYVGTFFYTVILMSLMAAGSSKVGGGFIYRMGYEFGNLFPWNIVGAAFMTYLFHNDIVLWGKKK